MEATVEEVVERRSVLPWDNEFSAGIPFHLYRWMANTKSGRMSMLDRLISREQNPETMQMEIVADVSGGEYLNKLEGEQKVVDMSTMTAIYQVSATHEIGLLVAMVKHFGEDNFSPSYIEKCNQAQVYIAHEKYAVAKPKPIKKKRAKRSTKKTSKTNNILDELARRQEESEE